MKFTSSVNIDFSKWTQVKMERENNMKEFRGTEEEMPKSVMAACLSMIVFFCDILPCSLMAPVSHPRRL
jgi:hypothetical protein